MAHVVLGAGLGGTIMAYELRDALGSGHRVSVVNKGTRFSFVPSNPWVAVGWRDREDIEVVGEIADDGSVRQAHEISFVYTMMLPAFRGVAAVRGIEGLTSPRGFILADQYRRNPTFKQLFSIGVCGAIPPVGKTPVPVGVPNTGFMIESMVTATAQNIASLVAGKAPKAIPTWNAVCLADFGDGGVAFVAQPQIPPRNVNWPSTGKWVHAAKVGFEKYFLHKICSGIAEPFYEKLALQVLGIDKLRAVQQDKTKT